jgi:hypothetical protein
MSLSQELKTNQITDYIAVNFLYGRTHEIVSQMNEDQLRIINENYPELITIAQRIGKANSMRTSFLKGGDENTTE